MLVRATLETRASKKKRLLFFFFTGLIFQLDPWSASMKTETEEGEKEV